MSVINRSRRGAVDTGGPFTVRIDLVDHHTGQRSIWCQGWRDLLDMNGERFNDTGIGAHDRFELVAVRLDAKAGPLMAEAHPRQVKDRIQLARIKFQEVFLG